MKSHPPSEHISSGDEMSKPRQVLFITVICMTQLLNQASLGQTLSILHIIGASFGITEAAELSWLIAGYSLTVGTFILIFGRMGDVFGYKRLVLIGLGWYALWSLVSGLAVYSNKVLFVFSRALAGIGPSITLPNALAMLGYAYKPGFKKQLAYSLFAAVSPTGIVLGATFAALFARTWWPSAFFTSAIVLALMTVVAWAVLPDLPQAEPMPAMGPITNKVHHYAIQLDLAGSITGVFGLVLFNFAWNQAVLTGWQAPYVCVTLVLGLVFMAGFIYIETHVSSFPLIPREVFNHDTAFILACIACAWGTFGIWIYYIWQYFEIVRDLSPLLACAWKSPVTIMGFVAAITTALILNKLHPSWVMVIALVATVVGTVLPATAPEDQTYWAQTFVCLIIMPWGMDMSFPAATLQLSDRMAREHQGVSASLVNTVVNYSISLALGFAGTVEREVSKGLTGREKVLKGFAAAWYFGVGLSVLGLGLSLLFVLLGKRREKRNDQMLDSGRE
ncbi:MFS general substrate transporter [Aspergillus egyptiacus]|nr:MFS general substrate transporter [Aspergillus egyptiacus]